MTMHLKAPVAVARTQPNQEAIDHIRRKLLAGAAIGLAASGAASLVPARPGAGRDK